MAAATTSSAPILVQTSAPTKSAATSDSVGFLSWSRGLAVVVLLVNMCLRL